MQYRLVEFLFIPTLGGDGSKDLVLGDQALLIEWPFRPVLMLKTSMWTCIFSLELWHEHKSRFVDVLILM